MLFNGANANERVALSANGKPPALPPQRPPTSRWTRAASRPSTSTPSAETDIVSVGDLTGTDVKAVNVDLAGTLGGTTADGATDRIIGRRHGRRRP